MLIGKVPDLGLSLNTDSRYGPIINLKRSNVGSNHVKALRDRSIMVEGVRLYNSVPRKIREYNGSYLGFKNCIDKWFSDLPDMPRELGNEPLGRSNEGKPSNSVKDWRRIDQHRDYDDSWVPKKKSSIVITEI